MASCFVLKYCAICKNNVDCPIILETTGMENDDMIDDEGLLSDVESLVYEVTSVAQTSQILMIIYLLEIRSLRLHFMEGHT